MTHPYSKMTHEQMLVTLAETREAFREMNAKLPKEIYIDNLYVEWRVKRTRVILGKWNMMVDVEDPAYHRSCETYPTAEKVEEDSIDILVQSQWVEEGFPAFLWVDRVCNIYRCPKPLADQDEYDEDVSDVVPFDATARQEILNLPEIRAIIEPVARWVYGLPDISTVPMPKMMPC